MKQTKTFTISLMTKYGHGIIKKKGTDFMSAYKKLSMSDRMKATMIDDEDGESISIDELLGLPLDSM